MPGSDRARVTRGPRNRSDKIENLRSSSPWELGSELGLTDWFGSKSESDRFQEFIAMQKRESMSGQKNPHTALRSTQVITWMHMAIIDLYKKCD